jgi:hypothetical protein
MFLLAESAFLFPDLLYNMWQKAMEESILTADKT